MEGNKRKLVDCLFGVEELGEDESTMNLGMRYPL